MSTSAARSKKRKYMHPKRGQQDSLHRGQRGLLVTCGVTVEHKCRVELYNVLNESLEKWLLTHPNDVLSAETTAVNTAATALTTTTTGVTTSTDVTTSFADALQSDLATLNVPRRERAFSVAQTGCGGLVFVAFSPRLAFAPSDFMNVLMPELLTQPKTRFACQCIPVDVVCRGEMSEILNALRPLVDKVFNQGDYARSLSPTAPTTSTMTTTTTTTTSALPTSPTTTPRRSFAVVWHRHIAAHMPDSATAAASIVPLVKEPRNVNLKKPDIAIVVVCVKGLACISVLSDYTTRWNQCRLHVSNAQDNNKTNAKKSRDVVVTENNNVDNDDGDDVVDGGNIDFDEGDDDDDENESFRLF